MHTAMGITLTILNTVEEYIGSPWSATKLKDITEVSLSITLSIFVTEMLEHSYKVFNGVNDIPNSIGYIFGYIKES